MLKQYLETGKIVGTHGVHGELRVEPWCDTPAFLCKFRTLYWKNGESVRVLSARVHKNLVLLTLEGVDTVDKADVLRGRVLYLDRADTSLPKDVFFIQDLVGLAVSDADTGRLYGTLTDVFATGANDVYEITAPDGKTYLIPAIRDVVIETDLADGSMRIRPIRGIFDDED